MGNKSDVLNASGSRHGFINVPEWPLDRIIALKKHMATSKEKPTIALAAFASDHKVPLDEVTVKWDTIKAEAARIQNLIKECRVKASDIFKSRGSSNARLRWEDWEDEIIRRYADLRPELSLYARSKEIAKDALVHRTAHAIEMRMYALRAEAVPQTPAESHIATLVDEKYKVGDDLDAVVHGFNDYGIFVTLPNETRARIAIGEISKDFVKAGNIGAFVSIGDRIKVRILSYDEQGRCSASASKVQPLEKKQSASSLIATGSAPVGTLHLPDGDHDVEWHRSTSTPAQAAAAKAVSRAHSPVRPAAPVVPAPQPPVQPETQPVTPALPSSIEAIDAAIKAAEKEVALAEEQVKHSTAALESLRLLRLAILEEAVSCRTCKERLSALTR